MISAAFKALGDLLSRDFRSVLFKAIGMTLALVHCHSDWR